MSGKASTAKPLSVFMRDKAKADCVICKLPDEIRNQLGKPASRLGFSRPDQIEWLRTACGAVNVNLAALNTHLNSRHDEVDQ